MATEVLMPQMGESIAEGTITRWLVQPGEKVERDQPLLEISTDKVDAEIPSPATGVLLAVHRQDGETVPVNEVVGLIGQPGESTVDVATPAAGAPALGEADGGDTTAAAAPEETPEETAAEPEEGGPMSLEERIRRFSSPLVRSIAAKEGIDLRDVEGTGLHSRVTKRDILGFLERRGEAAAAPAAASAPAASAGPRPGTVAEAAAPGRPAARPAAGGAASDFSVPAYQAGERVRVEPMSRIRQITAAHMTYSKATSAHVTSVFDVDMTRIARLRDRAKGRFQREVGTKLTFMPFIFQAVAAGLRRYPQLNAAIDGTDIVYKEDVNLGMAVALDHGLIVPVIQRADELSLVGLARAANDLAERARSKKLKPEEVRGGTFTVTNPGGFGSLFGTPIINQPQVAILGVGAIEKRPVVITDEDGNDLFAARTKCYLAITFDHRLIDGADADHFMATIKATLEAEEGKELAPYL